MHGFQVFEKVENGQYIRSDELDILSDYISGHLIGDYTPNLDIGIICQLIMDMRLLFAGGKKKTDFYLSQNGEKQFVKIN